MRRLCLREAGIVVSVHLPVVQRAVRVPLIVLRHIVVKHIGELLALQILSGAPISFYACPFVRPHPFLHVVVAVDADLITVEASGVFALHVAGKEVVRHSVIAERRSAYVVLVTYYHVRPELAGYQCGCR